MSAWPRTPGGLDHPAAGPASHLGAERRNLLAVQLHDRQADHIGCRGDLVQGRVDEHAGDLQLAAHLGSDPRGHVGRDGRGQPGHRIIPIAQASSETASSASSRRVIRAELDSTEDMLRR